ncbi:MAG: pyruvate dehydrogenase complex dihydrolipoamide acetyltransferase [Longimicrobiales bacterium]
MATKVHMEALSPTMEEGQLVRWLKNEGDPIKEGDVLAEIETDKATMELVARGSGVLRARMLEEGRTAPVGQVIAVIAGANEDISSLVGGGAAQPAAERAGVGAERKGDVEEKRGSAGASKKPDADSAAVAVAARGQTEQPRDVGTPDGGGEGEGDGEVGNGRARVKASPLARRLAAESGVELKGVAGSGPGGRIVRRDIEGAGARGPAAGVKPEMRYAPTYEGPDVEEIPVTQMRKTIAKRLITSIGPIPTFYLTIDVNMTRLMQAREHVNEKLKDSGLKTSVNDFLIKAVAVALARHPEVNASWGETVVRRYHRVHVGVAVAVEDGLITPVIRDADRKGVADIAIEVKELAARAREKKLKPEEYTGATFSISNLGMFGIEDFTAIINPPEAAILAVGQVTDTVVAVNGQPVVQARMRMTMSCDHRVVDGATGARFLQTLRAFVEEPVMILV